MQLKRFQRSPHRKPSSLVIGEPWALSGVFGERHLGRLAAITSFLSDPISPENWPPGPKILSNIEIIFGTWNLPSFSEADATSMCSLRAVFYSAGTVRYFAKPLLSRGVEVYAASFANAVPVAEFALAQILLANKGYFRLSQAYTAGRDAAQGCGNFGATVALLGAGEIGSALIERLRPFALRLLVFDPFLSLSRARELGVEKVSMEEAFALGDVVSNHLADLPATKGMLQGRHFVTMKKNATFINTGRGATVAEDQMVEALLARPDLTALLDVTMTEPLPSASPLRRMPNVHLSPHIAGSIGAERERLAEWMIGEYDSWQKGGAVRGRVSTELLERMA